MKYVLITGSSGLVGSESSIFFHNKNFKVLGIDNDKRAYFFGKTASTKKMSNILKKKLPNFKHFNIDIRNKKNLEKVFKKYNNKINCIFLGCCISRSSNSISVSKLLTGFFFTLVFINNSLYLIS